MAAPPADGGSRPVLPLTRRKLLETAFQRIGARCDGARPAAGKGCAQVVPDLLETFGLAGLIEQPRAPDDVAGVAAE